MSTVNGDNRPNGHDPVPDEHDNFAAETTLLLQDVNQSVTADTVMRTTDQVGTGSARFFEMSDINFGTPLPRRVAELPDLPIIGNLFEFRECIGTGGFCKVYKAFDTVLQRNVAIKTLSEKHNTKYSRRNAFIVEATVTAALDHPSIIPIHGLYTDKENHLHLVEKLVLGKTFGEIIRQYIHDYENLPYTAIARKEASALLTRLEIFLKICDAVGYAHNKQILHRDIKPENVMIGPFNEVYVMDWGIAETRKTKMQPKNSSVIGTFSYLAPEILMNKSYDSRSDIYSLGVLLFYLVYLKLPFPVIEKQALIEFKNKGLMSSLDHAFDVKIPHALSRIIYKATQVRPSERYQSVQALSDDLHRLLRVNSAFDSVFGRVRKIFGLGFGR